MDNISSNNSPQFPQEQKRPNVTVILSTVGIFVVLIFLAYAVYYYATSPSPIVKEVPLLEQRVTLTPEQAAEKKKIIEETDTSRVTLSQSQAEAKLLLIKQAQQLK
ncbi:MAG: hypothetical protein ABI430_03150 [Candidatus Taylorbacteria bacterium]